ncbi:MAG: hypothetical protein OEU68_18095 [Nitrospira sp.]|nr:hypothetical protein [Nitrospira sp.]MDH4245288.1 hypothetical protein [Nitrospira sp.]MDH4357174.1 hypothetical protein [Nitrospira sp.]MDH5320092.1 hypothetical protein [Nitrospira sp.]
MSTAELLDVIGGLTSLIKIYAAKLPAVVHLNAVPSRVKPSPETVDNYEIIVSRARTQSAGTPFKGLNDSFVTSLEAFEIGHLLGAIQPLLSALDHVERMQSEKEIEVGRLDEQRIREYRAALRKVLPGNRPELDNPT